MDFELTEEQQIVRDTARDFAEKKIKPVPFLKTAFYALIILHGFTYMGCAAQATKDPDKELYEQRLADENGR